MWHPLRSCFWNDIESEMSSHTQWCARTVIRAHTWWKTHTHTYTAYAHMCTCTQIHVSVMHIYACTRTMINTHIQTHYNLYKHTLTHTPWCAHIHTPGMHITHAHTHTHSLQVKYFFFKSLVLYCLHCGKCRAKEREQGLTNFQVMQLCSCRENGTKFSPLLFPEIIYQCFL